jgi:hypothetical protein
MVSPENNNYAIQYENPHNNTVFIAPLNEETAVIQLYNTGMNFRTISSYSVHVYGYSEFREHTTVSSFPYIARAVKGLALSITLHITTSMTR